MRWPWQKKNVPGSWSYPTYDEWVGGTSSKGIPGIKTAQAALMSYRAWVFVAVSLISNRTSVAELDLFIKNGEEEVPVTKEQFKFLNVWENPNPLYSGTMLRKVSQEYLELAGEAHIIKVKNNMGFPEQLWPVRPDQMELKFNDDGVGYFEYTSDKGKRRYELEDVIYLRYADPRDPLRGYSPFQATGMQYDIDMSVDAYQKTMFESGGFFQYALSTDQTMTETQIKSMRDGWYNTIKNLRDKFKPPILQKGLKPVQLQQDALDLGTDNTSTQMRDKILAAYGVPKALVGMLEGIQRANLEGTEFVFSQGQIEPRLMTWANALKPTLQMLDPRIQVRFKSTVPLDREMRRLDAESMQKMGALSVEETRELFGFDPDFRDGDTVLVPFNMMAVNPNETKGGEIEMSVNKTVPSDTDSSAKLQKERTEPSNGGSRHLSKSFWTPEKKDMYQKNFEDDTEARERRWMPPINRWATKWEKYGLGVIEEQVKMAKAKYAGWGIARVRADYKVKQQVPEDIQILILESSGKLHTLDFSEAANEALGFVGVTDPFNMDNPAVVEFLRTRTRKFTDELSIRYADDLEAILQTGIVEGQTVAEISNTFKEMMGWESEGYRATRIARTEVISVSNKARRDGFIEAGVPMKSWSSARDAVVRDTHIEADQRYSADPIPMTDEFRLASGAVGDPANTGEASEDINCRCTLRPERDEE